MRVIAIVSLAASAVLGLGAIFVAKAVLPHNGAQRAQAAVPVGQPMVVAKQDIKYGQKLEASLLTVARVPADAVPAGAFASVQQALEQDRGGPPVALTPISAKEPVLPAKLSGPGARPSVAAEIADGMRAYTIKVTDVSGVGGHALPGDRVDVVMMRDLTPDGDTRNLVASLVLQNVRVLGIDLNADLSSNKPASPSTATLEVPVADAQKLSVAANLGNLSLALRRTGQTELAQAGTVGSRDLTGAPAPVRRTGGGPRVMATEPRGPAAIVIEVAGSGKSPHRNTAAAAIPVPNLTKAASAATPGPAAIL